MLYNINRVIRTILIMLIIFAILLLLVKKVAEPAFSDLIAEPISEKIARKASDYLEMPPTPEDLVQFKEDAITNGWVDQNGRLNLQYKQLPDATEGTITVSYGETFMRMMNLHSSTDKVIYYQEPLEEEFVVSTTGAQQQIMKQNTKQTDSTSLEEIPLVEGIEGITKDSSIQQEKQVETVEQQKTTLQTKATNETEQVNSVNEAAVDLPEANASASENGVALYVNGVYFDAFVNKKDALKLAAFVEDAKIIDLVTSRVVWESEN
ncbi:hypothetical protein [Paenibacillus sp. Marseille-Q4541]|uniref:hypothetical protein n=1 Tax=Paenibacillus sp. Marseille-Q4541 TaxID=2831522 RepID=UPI001BAE029F|nr:hypothetical protein [Paenibacillus sp. Marseille-Q4541]